MDTDSKSEERPYSSESTLMWFSFFMNTASPLPPPSLSLPVLLLSPPIIVLTLLFWTLHSDVIASSRRRPRAQFNSSLRRSRSYSTTRSSRVEDQGKGAKEVDVVQLGIREEIRKEGESGVCVNKIMLAALCCYGCICGVV